MPPSGYLHLYHESGSGAFDIPGNPFPDFDHFFLFPGIIHDLPQESKA